MKIFISGKIGGLKPYEYASKFGYISARLKEHGHDVINSVELCNCMNYGKFDNEDYMQICFAAVRLCDAVFMLNNWMQSPGALREHQLAKELKKKIYYQENAEHGEIRL